MKFQLGEIAITRNPTLSESSGREVYPAGVEVEITSIGCWWRGHLMEYGLRFSDGAQGCAYEVDLRKKRPPIPPEVLEIFDVVEEEA